MLLKPATGGGLTATEITGGMRAMTSVTNEILGMHRPSGSSKTGHMGCGGCSQDISGQSFSSMM
jgi:hypothetical protein